MESTQGQIGILCLPPSAEPVTEVKSFRPAAIAIISQKKVLEDALKSLMKVVTSPTHAVTASVLIDFWQERGFINLTATDFRTYRMIRLVDSNYGGYEADTTARACVPAKLFYNIVKKLNPKEDTTLSLIGDRLYIKQGGNQTTIDCLPSGADEFPICPASDEFKLKHKIELDRVQLIKHMKDILKTVSKDSMRNLLQGYNLRAKDGILTISSTDGHRLTQKEMRIPDKIEFDATLRPSLVGDIEAPTTKTQWDLSKTVELLILEDENESQMSAMLSVTNTHYSSQTWAIAWDGQYPDVTSLRKEIGRGIVIDKGLLLAQLEIAIVYWNACTGKQIPFARLIANSLTKQFTVEAVTPEGNMEGDLSLCTQFIDRGFDVAINSKYLIDAMKSMKGDIEVNSDNKMIYIRQLGSSDEPILIMGVSQKDFTRAFPEPTCEYIVKEYDDRIAVSSPRNTALNFDVSKQAKFSKFAIPRENLIAELMWRVIDGDRLHLTKMEAKALYALRA